MKTQVLAGCAVRMAVILALGLVLLPAASRSDIPEESGDLMEAIELIRINMPLSGSEGFETPSSLDLSRWRLVSEAFLDDRPEAVDSLIGLYFPSYEVVDFVDTGFENHRYRILREETPPVLAWGTFILRVNHRRAIAIEVPHGRYETNTPSEGTDIFRRTGARLFIMNGAHRCANSAYTPCDGTSDVCDTGRYHISDMGHVTQSAYQVMHEEFTGMYPEGYSFSIHGMSQTNCNDIFLSNGTASGSKPILYELRDSMNASGNIVVSVAGDGTSTCTLIGSTNVQGRFTNSSPRPCYTPASSNNGHFIHAEQLRRVRDSYSVYSKFIDAINDAIDTVTSSGGNEMPNTTGLYLSVPWPNPSGMEIRFSLSSLRAQDVTVEVYDVSGTRVESLYRGSLRGNEVLNLTLQPERFSSGVYFIRAMGNGTSATRKVILIH
jgi:hypothetical protein